MPSLKAEIKAMQTTYLSAESKMKGGIVQRQRGTEVHRNAVRAVFKNSCAYLRQLVAAGLLPPHFSIGQKGVGYYYVAYIGDGAPIGRAATKRPKAEKRPLTESEREQKVALKGL